MYLPSLPTVAKELHASSGAVQATMAVFFAGLALGQLVYGPASDRFGRRGPILLGYGLFVAAGLACALAINVQMLMAARLAQALGGCASMVIARAIVRDHFEHRKNPAQFFSLLALVTGAAPYWRRSSEACC